ncbi:uncharacterized protein LY89DRAFT_735946 [Mollisia scopiformis]|uniref:Uncharacterized protein n=1 Tax=Mollisia scopiformis TaxID=149040 RepID=A0A194X4A0_MOLSC|nr:uncharacterized protein LY89DRAFT_735946 [Mollisia scopiformis]KUJ14884.1 hypothetical protein LY89DRAFT_735946 [Mollisia scopiformis]
MREITGLFIGFDLSDAPSLRYLAAGLEYYRDGGRDENNPRLANLSPAQRASVQRIVDNMNNNNPLLTEIIDAFLDTPRGRAPILLGAGRDLRDYAHYAVTTPTTHDYQLAYIAWNTRVAMPYPGGRTAEEVEAIHLASMPVRRRLSQNPRTERSRKRTEPVDEDEADEDYEPETKSKKIKKAQRKTPGNSMASTSRGANTARRSGSSVANPPTSFRDPYLDRVEALHDEVAKYEQGEEDKKAKQVRFSQAESEDADEESDDMTAEPKPTLDRYSRHTPLKKPSYKAIDDGTIDKTPATLGVRDDKKLIIAFDTQKEDPEHPGEYLPEKQRVEFDYRKLHPEFDFANKKHIFQLNHWRRQLIKRNFGYIRKARGPWLEKEKGVMLDLMREQLQRNSYIKWRRLANAYNDRQYESLQEKGEKLVAKGVKKSVTSEDRWTPWRTSGAIKAISNKWPEYHELVSDMKAKRKSDGVEEAEYSDDDKEVPDPDPEVFGHKVQKEGSTSAKKSPGVGQQAPSHQGPSVGHEGDESSELSELSDSHIVEEDDNSGHPDTEDGDAEDGDGDAEMEDLYSAE